MQVTLQGMVYLQNIYIYMSKNLEENSFVKFANSYRSKLRICAANILREKLQQSQHR